MDNNCREGEEAPFDIIRRSPSPDDHDDGSKYLNPSGEGMMFDEDERIDEGDEENVLQITMIGEVYLIYKPHPVIIICLNRFVCINESIFLLLGLWIDQIFYKRQGSSRPGQKVQHRFHQSINWGTA